MSASKAHRPTLDSVAPRFLVGDMEQALAFYRQLGFAAPYHDEGFAILERDQVTLQFNVSDPTHQPSQEGCRVCYITVTNIEALYQQYLSTGTLRSPIQTTDWGTKGFWLTDPFDNILIFEENIPEEERAASQGA
ncbi:MAG TPA: VOC family protein [Ktedonobacteraceae bacterium]